MNSNVMSHCAIVILAAGQSSRLGQPKQLLVYKGQTLLEHAADTALNTGCRFVYVVLGARIELLRKALMKKQVTIVENTEWQEGIASSIRCGLGEAVKTIPDLENIIFMVCDQPYVSSSLLLSMWEKQKETGMPVVACSYEDVVGTPALFNKTLFPSLMELKGDSGAGKLIRANKDKLAVVSFPQGKTDIDTALDYELLNAANDNRQIQ